MKSSKILILIFLTFSCVNHPSKIKDQQISTEFVQGSEDIPLLIGMEKIVDEENQDFNLLGFDSTSGSIMTSSYKTNISTSKIRDFYNETLPQLGWESTKDDKEELIYKRDNENLEINLIQNYDSNTIKFFITNEI